VGVLADRVSAVIMAAQWDALAAGAEPGVVKPELARLLATERAGKEIHRRSRRSRLAPRSRPV